MIADLFNSIVMSIVMLVTLLLTRCLLGQGKVSITFMISQISVLQAKALALPDVLMTKIRKPVVARQRCDSAASLIKLMLVNCFEECAKKLGESM